MKELKQLMKDVVLHNIGIKVLSLIGALFVWLIIINIDDPYKTKVFQVPVETINESALQSVNKVFEITSGSIANVKVGGKRSVIDRLDSTDIRATADLSNLSSVNAVNIVPSLRKKVSSDVTLECTQVLKVALEDMATKQVKGCHPRRTVRRLLYWKMHGKTKYDSSDRRKICCETYFLDQGVFECGGSQ